MPDKSKIKWREFDKEQLEKEVRKFNQKINRTLKNHPELADILPEKKTVKGIQASISSRQDYNREIKSLGRFLKRGAEKVVESKTGNRVTSWERKEIGYKVAIINRERTYERKIAENMPATSRGKDTGLKRGEMGNTRTNELKPKQYDFNKIKGGKEWKLFVESVEKQVKSSYNDEKKQQYKDNYIKGLIRIFGDNANDLIETISKIPADKVVNIFYSDQEATIDFIYDPIELSAKLDVLTDLWENVIDG